MAAGATGGAHGTLDVLGIEAHVHPRLVIGVRDQIAERLHRIVFEVGAERVIAPGVAHISLRAGAVSLRDQSAGKCKAAARGQRRLFGEEGPYRRGVHVLDPQHRLGAPAQRADRRPARIGNDEGGVAGKIGVVVVAAQDCPFHELARRWIADRVLLISRLGGLALAGQPDRGLDARDIGRRGGAVIGDDGAGLGRL